MRSYDGDIQLRYLRWMPTFKVHVELGVSALCLWAAIRDGNNLIPKIAPELISSIELVEGELGQAGSIILVKLGPKAPGGEDERWMKERFLSIDDEDMTMQIDELEGGHIAVGFTKWQSTIKLVSLGPDSMRLISTVEYEGDLDATIAIALHMEATPFLFRELEKHLQRTET